MINNQYTSQQQQEYEEEQQRPPPPLQQQPAHASTAGKKVLVFQPVKVGCGSIVGTDSGSTQACILTML